MSNHITKLISQISGSDKLEACLNISELNTVNDVLNLNEQTLENMEKFLRKKLTALPLDERRQFIDDDMLHNPDKFMIAPGLSQRILNACSKMATVFKNVPVNETNIALMSNNLLNNSTSVTKINRSILQNIIKNDRFLKLDSKMLALPAPLEEDLSEHNLYIEGKLDEQLEEVNLISCSSDENNDEKTESPQNTDLERSIHLNPPQIEEFSTSKESLSVQLELSPLQLELSASRHELSSSHPIHNGMCPDRSSYRLIESLTQEFLRKSPPSSQTNSRPVISNHIKTEATLEPLIKQEPVVVAQTDSSCPQSTPKPQRAPSKSKLNVIEYYYAKVTEDGARFFKDCDLVPKVDFDIELNVRPKIESKPCANFVCFRCQNKNRSEKKLKFYLTTRGAVINSNIINHLKIHYKLRH